MPLGLYLSVPFCRTKCSYCNFASDVFSHSVFQGYVERVCKDIANASNIAEQMGGRLDPELDSIYLGGGTPTILHVTQLEQLFVTIRQNFKTTRDIEITVECAPGTLSSELLDVFCRCGVNRISLGVQSFEDREAAAVGRLHKRATVLDDIAQLRAAGISNVNIDLIAGLPHQTPQTWEYSLEQTIACQVPHVSVYMLEVDEESRLGRELIAGGTRYHAHYVPDEDATADFYLAACDRLAKAGIEQYEISNFARKGFESRHNLKYWTRQPYLGFGVDAHSMLEPSDDAYVLVRAAERETRQEFGGSVPCEAVAAEIEAVRFSWPESLEDFLSGKPLRRMPVSRQSALEESLFLGLRLCCGVDMAQLATQFGAVAVASFSETIEELRGEGLLRCANDSIRLTERGRLLSNEVFQKFILPRETAV
ncbi:MAG TPA: radical SAM family heme chaperone HemW [Terriglobales bacterium]|nr:radical SAM family heme chaperone HemW [Terriglobales bacterium]